MRLKDKVSLVTGGASGIGRAIARLFAREGARVIIGDIDHTRGSQTTAEVNRAGGTCTFVACDVANAADAERLTQTAVATHGRVDILVNNAADLGKYGSVTDSSLDDWNRSLATGLTGTFLCSKYAASAMTSGGSIVNIASVGGILPFWDNVPYVTVKGAVIQLTRSMALDLGARGIRVNAVAPGAIDTKPVPDDLFRVHIARSVLGRRGRPEEVAHAALFLCSDEAAFITGACLPVDGGWLLGQFRTEAVTTPGEPTRTATSSWGDNPHGA